MKREDPINNINTVFSLLSTINRRVVPHKMFYLPLRNLILEVHLYESHT